MKFLMLARNPKLYSHRRLKEAAEAAGHSLDIVNTLNCYMNITSGHPQVFYDGEVLDDYDAVIPRIGASVTAYGLAVLRQFEMMGVYSLNASLAIARSRDKLRSLQLLARDGVDLPVTAFAHDPNATDHVLESVGGVPVVIKLLEGTQGIGVILGETQQSARSIIDAFHGVNTNILVQEFIKEAGASDIRAFVVGDEVVAAMKRTGVKGDFRSNIHRGGSAEPIELTDVERDMAVRAAKSMGMDVSGVDLMRAKRGPVVVEVNSSPGLEGIEVATGIDIAGKIIAFLEAAVSSANADQRK